MVHMFDLMIGDFAVSQGFGDNPATYNWIKDINGVPIKGHNGIDVATPTGTSLLNPFPKESDVIVTAVGFEPSGYGNYIRIWDRTQNCVILYGHCQTVLVKVGDKLFFQQEVAKSDTTGWATGPHCHIGFYLVDKDGNKLNRSNGFDGFLNIFDTTITGFTILDPKTPASTPPKDMPLPASPAVISIPVAQNEKLVTNSDNYQRVIDYLNLASKADNTPSKAIIEAITNVAGNNASLKGQLTVAGQEINNKDEQVKRLQQQLIDEEQRHAEELKNMPDFTDLKKTYDQQYSDLYIKYEDAMKQKGALLNQMAALKGDVVTAMSTPLYKKIVSGIVSIFSI